jgi:uncharacterized protein (UPF0332 family)
VADANAWLAKAEESLASAQADFDAARYNSCARSTYYACFHAAVAALIMEGVLPPRGKWGHEFVQGEFSNRLVYRRKLYDAEFRNLLQRAAEERLNADYSEVSTSLRAARTVLAPAHRLVTAVHARSAS